jgi:hypothetical protein
VHEIKHDSVRRDGPTVRLYSRNADDLTVRLAAIAAAAELIKTKSFTIDGEAVRLGPDGLSGFDRLSRREALELRSSTPSTFSSTIATTCSTCRSWPERVRWLGCCARPKRGILLQRTHRRRGTERVCRGPAWCRGHHLEENRGQPRLDQVCNRVSIAVQRERSERWKKGGIGDPAGQCLRRPWFDHAKASQPSQRLIREGE